MSFPRYPNYKDSGVEWLGEVPGHWDVVPLKFIANVQTGVAKGKDNSAKEAIQVPYLRVANVQDGYLDLDTIAEIEIPAEDLPRYRLQKGDVLMNEGGDFDKLGRGHIWDGSIEPCIHQNHVFAVRPYGVSPDWLNAITGSQYAQFYFMSRSKQSTNLASISSTNLMELPVVLPPQTEQTGISAFLDHETAKIDGLMAEQRRLMALLKEKRQAVISHAVTQGLNPHPPMKPSGIEWLGEVPAHWKVSVIKRFSTLHRGHDLTDAERTDGSYPVVTSSGINGTHGSFMAPGPGVVTGRYGSTGRLFYIEGDFWPHNTSLYVSNFHGNHVRFVWYSLQTVDFAAHSAKAAVPGIDRNDIHVLPVVVPPKDEQATIVTFLDSELAKLDTLTVEAQRAIDLLAERRSALISAAVTGQIDVRGVVVSL